MYRMGSARQQHAVLQKEVEHAPWTRLFYPQAVGVASRVASGLPPQTSAQSWPCAIICTCSWISDIARVYTILLPVAMVLLGLLCRINREQGYVAGVNIRCWLIEFLVAREMLQVRISDTYTKHYSVTQLLQFFYCRFVASLKADTRICCWCWVGV